jgi:membrane protease YdiL (CAAX protease family)
VGDALLGYLAGLVVAVLVQGVWLSSHENDANSLGALVSGTVGLWVGLAGAPLVASRRQGSGSLRADFGLRFAWWDPLAGAVAGVLAQDVLGLVVYLPFRSDRRLMNEVGQPAQHVTGLAHGPVGVLVLVLVLVVGAPVVEELFFRGLLLSALRHRLGAWWGAVLSSILFGLAHFEPLQFPVLALFGLVLAALKLRTGRLGPNICAHAAFNALAVYSLLSSR